MILSKASEYAIRAIIYIALVKRYGYTPIREISENINISFHFLTKVFQILTEKGLLESYRGPKGGIVLKKPAEEMSLYDIVAAIDGEELFEECVLGLAGCGDKSPCPVHEKWGPIRQDIKVKLMGSTIQSLVEKMESNELRLAEDQEDFKKWLNALQVK